MRQTEVAARTILWLCPEGEWALLWNLRGNRNKRRNVYTSSRTVHNRTQSILFRGCYNALETLCSSSALRPIGIYRASFVWRTLRSFGRGRVLARAFHVSRSSAQCFFLNLFQISRQPSIFSVSVLERLSYRRLAFLPPVRTAGLEAPSWDPQLDYARHRTLKPLELGIFNYALARPRLSRIGVQSILFLPRSMSHILYPLGSHSRCWFNRKEVDWLSRNQSPCFFRKSSKMRYIERDGTLCVAIKIRDSRKVRFLFKKIFSLPVSNFQQSRFGCARCH